MLSFFREGNRRDGSARSGEGPAPQPSAALQQMAGRLKTIERPNLLDLGPLCGGNIQFFASQGCRVFVEAAEDLRRLPRPAPTPAVTRTTGQHLAAGVALDRSRIPAAAPVAGQGSAIAVAEQRIAFSYPNAHFDGILLWDVADYLLDARAKELGQEMGRLCRGGALLLMFSDARKQPAVEPLLRYRLTDAGAVLLEPFAGAPIVRIARENRDLFRLFEGFEVVKCTLLRNQLREILLQSRS